MPRPFSQILCFYYSPHFEFNKLRFLGGICSGRPFSPLQFGTICGILYVLKYAHREPAAWAADPLYEKRRARAGGTGKLRRRYPDDLRLTPLAPSYARRPGPVPNPMRKDPFTMIKIAPSILSADFANLGRDIQRIDSADYVHVDVMDGLFVPNISIGIPVVKSIRPVTALPLDVHLMIQRPERYAEQFCDAGADIVTCHVEADTEENIHLALKKIHAKGKKAGVVVKPKTPASAVLPFISEVELILVMTVEPGFGGQKFMADMMPKVQQIRAYIDAMNPTCELEVDGGVDPDTCKICIASGANVLVAGSSVYKAEDIPARIRALRG